MSSHIMTHEAIIQHYADEPSLLDSALAGLSKTDLVLALSTDTWTINQIIELRAHMPDAFQRSIRLTHGV